MENLLNYLGCNRSLGNLVKVTRLGQRRFRRNRLMMICFDNEKAAKQILERSPRLRMSGTFNRIYVKKDLPREQRQVFGKSGNIVAEAAMGASERTGELPTNVFVNSDTNNSSYNSFDSLSNTTDTEYSDSDDSDETTHPNSDTEGDIWVIRSEVNSDVDDVSTVLVASAATLGTVATDAQPQAILGRTVSTAAVRGTPVHTEMDEQGELVGGVAVDGASRQDAENIAAIQRAISCEKARIAVQEVAIQEAISNERAKAEAHEAENGQDRGGVNGGETSSGNERPGVIIEVH